MMQNRRTFMKSAALAAAAISAGPVVHAKSNRIKMVFALYHYFTNDKTIIMLPP